MRAAWIYGPPGVGKSTAAWQLFEACDGVDLRSAYVDIDQLGMCRLGTSSDVTADALKAANLSGVLRNFARAGAGLAVISGVLDPRHFDLYESQLSGLEVSYCRLAAHDDEVRRRWRERGGHDEENLVSAVEMARLLDSVDLGHPVIHTDHRPPDEVARLVAEMVAPPRGHHGEIAEWRLLDAPPPAAAPRGTVTLVCGAPAVGKSTVAWGLFMRELARGVFAAFADLDQLGFLRPLPADEGVRDAVTAANARFHVGDVWGCRCCAPDPQRQRDFPVLRGSVSQAVSRHRPANRPAQRRRAVVASAGVRAREGRGPSFGR